MKDFLESFMRLKKNIVRQKKMIEELEILQKNLKKKDSDKNLIYSQIKSIKGVMKSETKLIIDTLQEINYPNKFANEDTSYDEELFAMAIKTKTKEKKASEYVRIANKLFGEKSMALLKKGYFPSMDRDLEKANMEFLSKSYVSIILFTTTIATFFSLIFTIFLLFFNFSFVFPFISRVQEEFMFRLLKVFWIFFTIPVATFFFMYSYPSLERKSVEAKINQELPFATINMAAISGSMIDPTKIFSIMISTREYPALGREFTKVINGVNVLGYDLVTTLRNSAFNNPSKKLTELFNGLATTINSGGDLPKFFDERAKTLLFEYKLDREKSIRAAETFMDIYLSIVIAAPMILILLLIIIQISGIGLGTSTSTITFLIILAVTIINIVFLTFLHIRQSKE